MQLLSILFLLGSAAAFAGYVLLLKVHRYRYLRYALLLLSSALILAGLYRENRSGEKISLAVMPRFGQFPDLDAAVCYNLNLSLQRSGDSSIRVKDMNWFRDSVIPDSLTDINYLRRFAAGADVDILLALTAASESDSGCSLAFRLFSADDKDPVNGEVFIDFQHPGAGFSFLGSAIGPVPAAEPDTVRALFAGSAADWRSLGAARRNELFGSIDKAVDFYRSIGAPGSDSEIAVNGLARSLVSRSLLKQRNGDFAEDDCLEAAGLLSRYISRDSLNAESFRLLGRTEIIRERWNRAGFFLGKALQHEPDNPFVLTDIGRLHEDRIRKLGYNGRLELYLRVLEINPACTAAALEAADIYYFRNEPGKAVLIYEKMLDLNPGSLDVLMALGKMYVLRNDVLKIIEIYEKILALKPDYGDAYYNLGIAYFHDEKPGRAEALFKRALEQGGSPDSHYYLGVIYGRRGQREQAIEQFRARIRKRTGADDEFAEEARQLLFRLLNDETFHL